ncbi:MAG: 30S ribosomal protein S7 [Candidatus Woesearchaeota archaeon]
MDSFKVFGKWSIDEVELTDPGLKDYLSLKSQHYLSSFGRLGHIRFYKAYMNPVERLINKLMIPGHKGKKHFITSRHFAGKKLKAMKIVKKAFEIIEKEKKKNPVVVFYRAIENAAPCEEITTIEYGGARYPKAVDCSPVRRIDLALRFFIQSAYQRAFNSKKKIYQTLAEEIMNAYDNNTQSMAIVKRQELEKQADASR